MGIKRLSPYDPGSYSNIDEAVITHLDVTLECDFDKEILTSEVFLTTTKKKPDAKVLCLDTRDLTILKVTEVSSGKELPFHLDEPIHTFGSKLSVDISTVQEQVFVINIVYITSKKATALQWLTPEQTAGGKHPYLFSQCQPDHCRSIIPCQDSPSVRCTYAAKVIVPKELTALMSAVSSKEAVVKENGTKEYYFKQDVPIPCYLLAIAVGNLKSRKLGPRSHIWSEPELVDFAANEFANTDELLKTAESLCGEYVWTIYDLLVLPPSFPFGGMENPCVTFITPTLLAGDGSLVTVIAHEISHSWTGNLVSIKNFEHFWLNEGFTTFIERKIDGRLKGNPSRDFEAIRGLKDLRQAVKVLGETNPLTKLVVDLTGVDPDDAFSVCPYEKGSTFLFYLEQQVGGPDAFEPFLRAYFEKYKYTSVETNDFKHFLYEYFAGNENLKNVDWDLWLYSAGMPPIIPQYDDTLQKACTELVDRWMAWNEEEQCAFVRKDIGSFLPEQVEEFLAILLELENVPLSKVQKMDEIYTFSYYRNSEIKFRWLRLCIKVRWSEKVDSALEFANSQGRMKYSRPIYRDLGKWEDMREIAVQSFIAHRNKMMQVLVRNLEHDLGLSEPKI